MRFNGYHMAALMATAWMSCVDEVDFDVEAPPFQSLPWVIDCTLASGSPASAVLSKGYPADGGYYYTPVLGAAVEIIDLDDSQVSVELFPAGEAYNGSRYQAFDTIDLVEGHRYQLQVTLPDFKRFESTPQRVQASGQVDSIYFEFVEGFNPSLNREEDGFNVYIDSTLPAGGENYTRWQVNGTYLIRTEIGECGSCVSMCWISEREALPLVSSTRFSSGQSAKRTFVKYIPINYSTFNDRYRVEVVQHAISRDAWEFYDALRYQLENAASLFQPAFSSLKGNVYSVKAGVPVIGIFTATLPARNAIFITGKDIPYKVRGVQQTGDCRNLPNSTAEKPPFWNP